jgi:hypothetical protein
LIYLKQLLLAALGRATFFVALATISRGRRCRRGADERCKSRNQKKIFHKVLLLNFVEELGHDFSRAEPTLRRTRRAVVELVGAESALLHARR